MEHQSHTWKIFKRTFKISSDCLNTEHARLTQNSYQVSFKYLSWFVSNVFRECGGTIHKRCEKEFLNTWQMSFPGTHCLNISSFSVKNVVKNVLSFSEVFH